MPTKTSVADHLSAIVDLAKTVGMKVIYEDEDMGLVIIGDAVAADQRNRLGVYVEITLNERGQVKTAHKRVDGVSKGDINGQSGNAGQRLLWTLHLFSRR